MAKALRNLRLASGIKAVCRLFSKTLALSSGV